MLSNFTIISLPREKYINLSETSKKYNLDFDDTYQTTLAQEFGMKIVTMDRDFNKVKNIVEVEFL